MKSFVRWKVGLWALLVLLAAALMACGLADSFSFIGRSPTYFEGHRMVLLGALAFGRRQCGRPWNADPCASSFPQRFLPSSSADWRYNCRTASFSTLPGWHSFRLPCWRCWWSFPRRFTLLQTGHRTVRRRRGNIWLRGGLVAIGPMQASYRRRAQGARAAELYALPTPGRNSVQPGGAP